MSSVTILGAGAWGTALAIQAARAGGDVELWARNGADDIAVSRESPRLPGHRLPHLIHVTGRVPPMSGLVVAAVPTQSLRVLLGSIPPAGELVVCAKGIATGTLLLPLEIAADVWPSASGAVLTGPHLAGAIASGL